MEPRRGAVGDLHVRQAALVPALQQRGQNHASSAVYRGHRHILFLKSMIYIYSNMVELSSRSCEDKNTVHRHYYTIFIFKCPYQPFSPTIYLLYFDIQTKKHTVTTQQFETRNNTQYATQTHTLTSDKIQRKQDISLHCLQVPFQVKQTFPSFIESMDGSQK